MLSRYNLNAVRQIETFDIKLIYIFLESRNVPCILDYFNIENYVQVTDYCKQVVLKMKRLLLQWIQHDHNFDIQKTEIVFCLIVL